MLKRLIRIRYQYDIIQFSEQGVLLSLSTHVDHAILEASPMLSHNQDACILKCICHAIPGRLKFSCIPRKHAPPIRSYAWLDCFFYRAHADLISRLCYVKVSLGDPVIFFDIVQSLLLIN